MSKIPSALVSIAVIPRVGIQMKVNTFRFSDSVPYCDNNYSDRNDD